ncbi:MAG: single-stranded DNA-binding protein [Planctomycetes bacterium]|jgi:hypothetical protein|nr:single-stranded DNA-binding protein [Planctomycetota bacterium]|tara:strand:- start:3399 stop:4301 length:903 start_codon:yes stop_codon:yes gene_type:complete
MSSALEALKKSKSNFDTLTKQLEKTIDQPDKKNKYQDDRLWKPELDKSGNGFAIIRFLPAIEGEDMPWQRVWHHAFQGPGGQWYIENSLTTLNKKDPVSVENTRLWNTGVESDKDIARKRKRKLQYYSNILVVSDPKHPENDGKIFLYKFGKKIFDKITEAMNPAFEDEKATNPFDFWEGANFKLKIRKVDGFWNYDKSEFEQISKVKTTDDEIDKIWKSQYALKPFVDPTSFKPYDELKEKLNRVLTGTRSTESVEDIDLPPVSNDVPTSSNRTSVEKEEKSNGSDDLSYFSKLAEDDS